MNDVLKFYEQQCPSVLPEFRELQAKGLAHFLDQGFPTRHDEDWKYSAPDLFLKQRFQAEFEALNLPEVKGVVVLPLEDAMQTMREKLHPYLSRFSPITNGFQALNTAMLKTGVVIYIPAGVKIDEPIRLSHQQQTAGKAVYLQHWVIAEAGSEASIIEDYSGQTESFTSNVTEIFLEAQAHVTHVYLQRESLSAYHVSQTSVYQAENSVFHSHVLSTGARWARADLSIALQGSGARCLMNGIYVLSKEQHRDHHTTVRHQVSGCESEQDYKGIVGGVSQAIFNGRVVVDPHAQKTKAMQQNKNLMLSKTAEVDTKPQLEIFANDVVCSHGATVGQLDENAIFYLATRGLDRQAAEQFLMDAFTTENLNLIDAQALRAEVTDHLKTYLKGG